MVGRPWVGCGACDVCRQVARVPWQIPEQALPVFAASAIGTTSAENPIQGHSFMANAWATMSAKSPLCGKKTCRIRALAWLPFAANVKHRAVAAVKTGAWSDFSALKVSEALRGVLLAVSDAFP